MRAQSAALGIAAAAAFSSAASALPCAETSLGQNATSELTCTVTDKTSGLPAREQQGDPEADAPQDDSQPPVGQSALFFDITEAGDAEAFGEDGIKITNLQATMTSNKYIAGRLPTARGHPGRRSYHVLSGLSVDQDAAAHPEAKPGRGRSRHSAKAAGKRIRHNPSRPMVSATETLEPRSRGRREWREPP